MKMFKYKTIQAKLKTNKSRDYLWNKMNSPKKILEIEHLYNGSKIKKISENNYEVTTKKRYFFLMFFPKSGINIMFINKKDDSSLAWFEIIGEKNCTLIHGNHVRVDDDNGKWYKEHKENARKHFMEEIIELAK